MRRLAALLALFALLPLAPATAAGPTMTIESQAWWSKEGITVPTTVGHHIHVAATIPVTGTIVNGRVDVPVHLVLHDQVGAPNFIRWQDGSTTKGQIALKSSDFTCVPHPDFTDCARDMVLPVDFAGFGTGLRELRISLNVPDEQPDVSGAQRMYQSFGLEVCVRACSPIEQGGRSLSYIEARGWYDDTGTTGAHGYQNARITSGIDSVRAGGTVTVKLAPGSGGTATKYAGAFIDPDMHHHIAGTVLLERSGAYSGTVKIPSDLSVGTHKLVLVASDGKNAGVLAIGFTVGGTPPTGTPAPTATPAPTPTPTATPTAFPTCVIP